MTGRIERADTIRAERVLGEWESITARAGKVYESLDEATKPAYFELVYMLCLMQTNLNKLYISCESFSLCTVSTKLKGSCSIDAIC
jgi:hypothetical protein